MQESDLEPRVGAPRIVLLPGLDGTGLLFEPFVQAAPTGVRLEVVTLPRDVSDYARLVEMISERIQRLSPAPIILAESFSGPLAIELAARHDVAALILCNTFAVAPYSHILGLLMWPSLFRRRLPRSLVRHYLVGRNASVALLERARDVISSVSPGVLAARLRAVLNVDVREALARCKAPIQYLRGTDDRLIHERSVREIIHSARTAVSVECIRGPHLLLQVEAEQAWRAIDAFLE